MRGGRVHATNWHTLQREYGETQVRVLTATGRRRTMALAQVKAARLCMNAPARKRIVKLQFEAVVVRARGTKELDGLVHTLGTTRTGGHDDLQHGGFEQLETLWARTRGLSDRRVRDAARARLSAYAQKGWGVSLRARPTLRIPGDPAFPAACARRAGKTLLDGLGRGVRPQVERMWQKLRIVRTKPDQVGSQLCNWRKWCAETYVPGVQPACTCKHIPGVRAKHKIDGHLAMRGRDYTGPGARALQCSEKTPIARDELDETELRCDLRRAVCGLVSSLPARLRAEVDDGMIASAVRAGARKPGDRAAGRSVRSAQDPTRDDVRVLRDRFEGLVISSIDKERGELAVL